jgi:hypothetical protein
MAEEREVAQTHGVRLGRHRLSFGVSLGAGVIFLGALSASASMTTPGESRPAPAATALQARSFNDEMAALESLREDVGRHPNDFMTFETRIAANRFIAEHEGAYHETESRVILRGVIGYWQSKTLVVLPSLSISDRL